MKERIGRYKLHGLIGSGGMGAVYRGQDENGAVVAVKVLDRNVDEETTRRFVRESQIRIEHPNIVKVLDAGVADDGELYLVLELLEGESLAAMIKRGPEQIARVLDIGLQALSALKVAHARGIVHRDIKPANLFRCRDGTIKVLDFGIALLLNEDSRITTTGKFIGTPGYLSPEQACGEKDVDQQADVWAMGALLHELITGKPVFVKNTLTATLLAIVQENPQPLVELVPNVPAELSDVIHRALAKSKGRRWKSAEEFRSALASVDVTIVPMGFVPPPVRKARPTMAPNEERIVAVLLGEGVNELGALERVVDARDGVLIRLIGRRAIGLFGGEKWEGDEVQRAASAALAAREFCERVAVASGRASTGEAGLFGEVIERVEASCSHRLAGVATDTLTARMVEEQFETAVITSEVVELKRRKKGVTMRSGEGLFAREAELEAMQAAIARMRDQRESVIVCVEGPQGIGKSRLAAEMTRLLLQSASPILPFIARGEPLLKDTGFSLASSLLRDHLRGASEDALRDLVARVIEDKNEIDRTVIFLGEMLGMRTSMGLKHDARWLVDRMQLAFAELFRGLCTANPVALVLDDLQWADRQSKELIFGFAERMRDLPLLIFLTTRPELFDGDVPPILKSDRVVRLQPRMLTQAEVARITRARIGRTFADRFAAAITERTGGNPFFVEQMMLAIEHESRKIEDPARLPLPLTVEAAVQSRLDHLPREEKELLKHAALLFRAFKSTELESLGFLKPAPLLDSLVKRGMLETDGRLYRFQSKLVSEVAYRLIAPDLRKELHRSWAQIASDRETPRHEEIALHFERGGVPARAAHHLAARALEAARHFDSDAVLRCVTRAFELDPTLSARFDLQLARAEALSFSGRKDEQLEVLVKAEACASNAAEQATVLAERSFWMSSKGRLIEALTLSSRAVELADQSGDVDVIIRALGRHVTALVYASKLEEADAVCERAMSEAERASVHSLALVAGWRAQIASQRGDLGQRRDAFASAAELYELAGDVRRAAAARTNLADLYNRVGAYDEAERSLRRALDECRRVGYRLMEGYALLNLGYARSMLKNTVLARAAFDDAAGIAAATNDKRLDLLVRIYRSRWMLDVGHATAAERAEKAAEDASKHKMTGLRATALWVAARAWLEAGDASRALTCSSEAMKIRDELGSLEEDEGDLFLTHAQVLRALKREDEARTVLERARERLDAIAASTEDPDWRRRLYEDVDTHRRLVAAK